MRGEWAHDVLHVLGNVTSDMLLELGHPVHLEPVDFDALAPTEVVTPKFTMAVTFTATTEDNVKAISKMWEACRAEHPNLWSYQTWVDAKIIAEGGTESLSADSFADYMRAQRNG